jgi:hypothetical protein
VANFTRGAASAQAVCHPLVTKRQVNVKVASVRRWVGEVCEVIFEVVFKKCDPVFSGLF